jgi:uncharacterized protein YciI
VEEERVIVYQIAVTTADDYMTRREPHRRAHLERLMGLRAAGICIGGGPAPDGRGVDLVYRLQQPWQVKPAMEEDPYWTAGAWTAYEPRSFAQFVEPWEQVPLVTDGSRRVTVVEGPTAEHDMAQFALIEMRGAGRVHFGGFFEGAQTWALARTADAEEAHRWFVDTGFWKPDALTTRPLLHVL